MTHAIFYLSTQDYGYEIHPISITDQNEEDEPVFPITYFTLMVDHVEILGQVVLDMHCIKTM